MLNHKLDTSAVIDHFFRHESGKVQSHLMVKFGKEHIELIEDAVQETLIKAMRLWPFKGIPDNPSAWILSVAKNDVYDQLRRLKLKDKKTEHIVDNYNEGLEANEVILESQLNDDFLNMMFACCHPSISEENQIILILKVLCGFGNHEIAKSLLKSEVAIAKSYTRAKRKLKYEAVKLKVPIGPHLNERLEVILKVIYLMFNEGYSSSANDELIKRDICLEAMRLTKILIDHPLLNKPSVNAIMALMCFQVSRFNSRQDKMGNIITLDKQDRTLWDYEIIEIGVEHLTKASLFGQMTEYQLQASIAACHSLAKSYQNTNWDQILGLYDALLNIRPNAIISLNRVVALGKVNGAAKALIELGKLKDVLKNNHLLYAIEGSLLEDMADFQKASKCYEKAILLTNNVAEKNHLSNKILEIIPV